MGLPLEDFLLDGAGGDEAVDETILLLAVSPDSSQGLLVGGRGPIRIKQYEAVRSDEIDAAASRLATQQKDEFVSVWIVETINQFLTLVHVHGSVEA